MDDSGTAPVSQPTDLPSLRNRIDALDADLVRLLNERANVSINIGLAKQKAAKAAGVE
ncbi:hypothetical protein HK097_005725, partial [Rhizophlyctis rosea]